LPPELQVSAYDIGRYLSAVETLLMWR